VKLETLVPPNDVDAEQAVLGSMLISRDACARGLELLSRTDFYRPAHGEIFDCIGEAFRQELPLDPITLIDELRKRGKLDVVGGAEYIALTLPGQVPSASRIEHYCRIVKEKALLRALATAGREITDTALDPQANFTAAHGRAVEALLAIQGPRSVGGLRHIREILPGVWDGIGVLQPHRTQTGIGRLDWLTGGIGPGLTLIAARPSMGKTALMLQIARQAGVPVAFFSLETGVEGIVRRLITGMTAVDSATLRSTRLSDEELVQVTAAIAGLHNLEMYLADSVMTVGQICAAAKRCALVHGIQMVMVDYIQLVRPDHRDERREQQVAAVTRALKGLAQDLKLPVIAAAQLSRATERRSGKIPELADLRESGELEAAADLTILIHTPKPEEDDGSPRPATLYVAKQKDGPTGPVTCMWEGRRLRFFDQDTRQTIPAARVKATDREEE